MLPSDRAPFLGPQMDPHTWAVTGGRGGGPEACQQKGGGVGGIYLCPLLCAALTEAAPGSSLAPHPCAWAGPEPEVGACESRPLAQAL